MTDEWGSERLDLAAYLDRTGCTAGDDLATLHRAHVGRIPFENVDVVLGRGVDPDLEAVQDKLVRRRRGGYCYEHATLFGAALERLGYAVRRLLARVGDDTAPRTHMLLAVRDPAGERWFCDVGFGSGLLRPLPWRDGAEDTQGAWTFGLAQDGELWRFRERTAAGWAQRHVNAQETVHVSDVLLANHFTATWPSSAFLLRVVAMRTEEDHRLRLLGRELAVVHPDGSEELRELAPAELVASLRADFRILLTPADEAALTGLEPSGTLADVPPGRA